VRGKAIRGDNYRDQLSHQQIPKIAAPTFASWGELLRFLMQGEPARALSLHRRRVPYRREGEDPTRMFAGEGTPERTNRRFHYLSAASRRRACRPPSTRSRSTARTRTAPRHLRQDRQLRRVHRDRRRHEEALLGLRPVRAEHLGVDDHQRPGADHAGVLHEHRHRPAGRETPEGRQGQWEAAQKKIDALFAGPQRPRYDGELPEGNDGLGLGLLGISGDQVVDAETYAAIKKRTLGEVRGTVQADILKEDQAQNTCIFSTEFALKMMGDVQQYFVENAVRNFYSVSISRLPHRRGRREPDLAARLHARQRLHHRRVLPRARHEDRRLRAEPVVLLLQRHGPGVHRDRPRGAAHLGARDARALRRQRRAARC
jgi:methylmalonyl-CoA mutase